MPCHLSFVSNSSRSWECDAKLPANDHNASDIARQMVEDSVGRGASVILGGGRANFRAAPDPSRLSSWECREGRDSIGNELYSLNLTAAPLVAKISISVLYG